MRALVIDDDSSTVAVISSSVHWADCDIDTVDKAYNLEQAQRLMLAAPVDVAICDIEMPMGSGLELIAWARERQMKTEFIFLTCHESFEFAQTAIRYGASGYVVKPFAVESMDEEVHKAVFRIRRARYVEEYGHTKSGAEENFWRKLYNRQLTRGMLEGELERQDLGIKRDDRFQLVLFSVQMDEEGAFGEKEAGMLEYALANLISEVLFDALNQSRIITFGAVPVFYAAAVCGVYQDQQELKRKCGQIRSFFQTHFGGRNTCYIGMPCGLLELAESGERLERMDRENVSLRERTFLETDFPLAREEKEGIELDTEQLSQWLEKGRQRECLLYLKRFLEELKQKRTLDRSVLRTIQQDLIQTVYHFLAQKQIRADSLYADEESTNLRGNAVRSLYDMMKWQNSLVTKAVVAVEELKKSQTVIQKAVDFINRHYCENITRREVAAAVYLTPEYLAKLFKKEMGTTVKSYINHLKIEKAKQLLQNEQAKIGEIAVEVGLDNFSYFSTIFKKSTGLTPQEYRNGENASFQK